MLVIPDIDACRALARADADARPKPSSAIAAVRAEVRQRPRLRSTPKAGQLRPHRAPRLLGRAASLDTGEMTDKGSINQRAVLTIAQRWSMIFTRAARPPTSSSAAIKEAAHDHAALVSRFDDAVFSMASRTPFADLNGALSQVSPIDLGIKVGARRDRPQRRRRRATSAR